MSTIEVSSGFNTKATEVAAPVSADDYVRAPHDGKAYAVCVEDNYGYYIRTKPERTLISETITPDMKAQLDTGAQIVKLPCTFTDPEFVAQEDLRAFADQFNAVPVVGGTTTADNTAEADNDSLSGTFNTVDIESPTTKPQAPSADGASPSDLGNNHV